EPTLPYCRNSSLYQIPVCGFTAVALVQDVSAECGETGKKQAENNNEYQVGRHDGLLAGISQVQEQDCGVQCTGREPEAGVFQFPFQFCSSEPPGPDDLAGVLLRVQDAFGCTDDRMGGHVRNRRANERSW